MEFEPTYTYRYVHPRPMQHYDNIVYHDISLLLRYNVFCYHDNCHRYCKRVFVRPRSKKDVLLVPLDLPII